MWKMTLSSVLPLWLIFSICKLCDLLPAKMVSNAGIFKTFSVSLRSWFGSRLQSYSKSCFIFEVLVYPG